MHVNIRNCICAVIVVVVHALFSSAAFAVTTGEILEIVLLSRQKVAGIVAVDDPDTQHAIINEVNQASLRVNQMVEAIMADEATTQDIKDKINLFIPLWGEFVKTRDEELIPAALAGEKQKAKLIGQGVQLERIKTMTALLK